LKLRLLFALLFVVPLASFAGEKKQLPRLEIDAAPACKMDAESFFNTLVAQDMIVTKPVRENNTFSVFRPHFGRPLYAQGMRVSMVFGYVRDQIIFRQPGQPVEFYGIVVDAGIANVQAVLSSIGSSAKTRFVNLNRTEITCIGA
jgi:hypothetical protein